MPKIARAISVRPEPTKPARPTISPRRSSNETPPKTPRRPRPSAFTMTSPISASSFGNSCSSERPTISWIISACGQARRSSRVATCWPSRRIVTVSEIAVTSSSRWLMKTIATPRSRRPRMIEKSRSTSGGESAAVGSSMIRRRASDDSALAISSSWRSATPRPLTGRSGPKSAPSSSRIARARDCISRQSTVCAPVRGMAAGEHVLGDAQVGEDRRLLVHREQAEPVGGERVGDRGDLCRRSGSAPLSECTMPVRILTSVDLPAPFSPTSACTEDASMLKLTSATACTPP